MGGNAHRKVQAERVLSSQFLRILEAPYACAAYGAGNRYGCRRSQNTFGSR